LKRSSPSTREDDLRVSDLLNEFQSLEDHELKSFFSTLVNNQVKNFCNEILYTQIKTLAMNNLVKKFYNAKLGHNLRGEI
jgi:hypothetical protein